MNNKYTLITTCYNEIANIVNWIDDIENQTRKPDEILVVDSNSNDGTKEVLEKWAEKNHDVKTIFQKCTAAAGRNIAVKNSKNDIFVSTDMGVRIDKKWFEEIVKPLDENPDLELVMGNYEVNMEEMKSISAKAEKYCNGNGSPFYKDAEGKFIIKSHIVPSNRSLAFKKHIWEKIGGWPEDLTLYADDSVVGRQIKLLNPNIGYAPKAIVIWERPNKLRSYLKEMYVYGIGDGEAFIKIPVAFRLYTKNLMPKFFVPLVNALRLMVFYSKPVILLKVIKKLDLPVLFFIPLFGFLKGFYHGKGFLVGFEIGNTQCIDCRKRLEGTIYTSNR